MAICVQNFAKIRQEIWKLRIEMYSLRK